MRISLAEMKARKQESKKAGERDRNNEDWSRFIPLYKASGETKIRSEPSHIQETRVPPNRRTSTDEVPVPFVIITDSRPFFSEDLMVYSPPAVDIVATSSLRIAPRKRNLVLREILMNWMHMLQQAHFQLQ